MVTVMLVSSAVEELVADASLADDIALLEAVAVPDSVLDDEESVVVSSVVASVLAVLAVVVVSSPSSRSWRGLLPKNRLSTWL